MDGRGGGAQALNLQCQRQTDISPSVLQTEPFSQPATFRELPGFLTELKSEMVFMTYESNLPPLPPPTWPILSIFRTLGFFSSKVPPGSRGL